MKASSGTYVKLQTLYKEKARKDAKEVLNSAQTTPGGELVKSSEVDIFCKNARFVTLINAKPSALDLGEIYGTSTVVTRNTLLPTARGRF